MEPRQPASGLQPEVELSDLIQLLPRDPLQKQPVAIVLLVDDAAVIVRRAQSNRGENRSIDVDLAARIVEEFRFGTAGPWRKSARANSFEDQIELLTTLKNGGQLFQRIARLVAGRSPNKLANGSLATDRLMQR